MKEKLFKWHKREDMIALPYRILKHRHYAIIYKEKEAPYWTEGTIHKEDLEKFHQINYNSKFDFREFIKNMFSWDWSLLPTMSWTPGYYK